jgi:hypothetical protein
VREASIGHVRFNVRPRRRIPFGMLVLAHWGVALRRRFCRCGFYLRRAVGPELIGPAEFALG